MAAASPPLLRTARLVLRAPAPGDAPALARLANDRDVARMTTRMPHPYGLADAEGFVERAGANHPDRDVTWVIQDGSGPMGVLGFFTEDPPSFGPELGYWIGRPAWGRGYATEAVGAAVAWSDAAWRRPCLVAGCFTDNPASARVLDKCGFLPTGVTERRASLARGGEAPVRLFIRMS